MYMTISTVGNGMDIPYDVWWNPATYQIDRMHAKGRIGDNYQDQDTSPLQINTLPDTGLLYPFVALSYVDNVTVRDNAGHIGQLEVFTSSNGIGDSLIYWVHPGMPLPVKIQIKERNYAITMMLLNYRR